MTKHDAAIIWPAVRHAMAASGLSDAEIARRAGLTAPQLSAYRNGAKIPRVDTVDRILHALGATVACSIIEGHHN